ncbi:MAG: hypothetical protein KDC44_19935, partial [Phaeodactylibacter sp.]|nr:hypothetical protein [Phaeodactylibacter sp.]
MAKVNAFLFTGLLLLFLQGVGLAPSEAQTRCMADELRSRPPLAQVYASTDILLPRQVITIPVVVHVVYRTEAENISIEQILSQLEVLNADYRAQNDDQDLVPFYYADLIADTEIEFCLATQDPQGNWTIGITRTQTDINGIGMLSQVHYT